jgi:hypothetical protein
MMALFRVHLTVMQRTMSKKRQRPSADEDCEIKPPGRMRRKLSDEAFVSNTALIPYVPPVKSPETQPKSNTLKKALRWYGRRKMDIVLRNEEKGWIWIMNTKTSFGFARITNPEWGYLSLDDIIPGNGLLEAMWMDELPCTFRDMVMRHPEIAEYLE